MKPLAPIIAIALACPAVAVAKDAQTLPRPEVPLPRITAIDARYAANTMFETYAGGLGERLVIAPCKPAGERSRKCIVRVGSDRYLAISSYLNREREVRAQARRLR